MIDQSQMRIEHLGFGIVFIFFSMCSDLPKKDLSIELKYQAYCSSCHLTPDPKNITKSIWKEKVLPEMGARMGYKYNRYNPIARNSMEENLYIRMSNTYPNKPTIDSATWSEIHDYIVLLAPDSIPVDGQRSLRNIPLDQFRTKSISLDQIAIARVTNIQFKEEFNGFVIGDAYGASYTWPLSSEQLVPRFNSPMISYHQKGNDLFFTEIGFMNPSEKPLGVTYKKRGITIDTLAKELHRPVYTEVVDLNEDGKKEIIICEFGNLTGELSMLVESDSRFVKQTLLPVPGTIKVEIIDADDDGKLDIVVLASQGSEGIYILYQKDNLQFVPDHVIRLGPEYGLSWFETLDYDSDGDLDIVLVNGDNADYSVFPKPYHGLRLFLNNGSNKFEEKWFYPIYGATRVLSEDYDLDGDFDFAVMAFFPDYNMVPEENFVYLENQSPDKYLFRAQTIKTPPAGRWLVMDKGDVDRDGDVDLLLGSFILSPGNGQDLLLDKWREENVDILFMENQAN